jgi:EmrB/QacA subfamily drug resistance transporter
MNNDAIKRAALIIACLSSFLTPFMGSSINIALPSIEKEFQIDAVFLSWIATSYLLAVAVSLVPFGRMADIYGRKKIYTFGIISFTVFSLLSALAISAPMLIIFRIFQGIGSAMIFATGIAILTSVFPPQERGKALGINVAAVYIGLSLGPFLGGFLTQHFTWRSIFLLNIPLGLIIILLIFWKLKGEWAEAKGEKFDVIGSFIYGIALIAFVLSLLPDMMALWMILLLLLGLVGISVFVMWETKIKSPVFEVKLFMTNKVFAFSNLAALINYSATFAVTFFLSLYLQHVKGLSPQNAGFILIAQPIVMVVCSPFAGRLSDRIEPRIVASLGMTVTTFGLFFFILLNENSTLLSIIARLILLGIGLALFSSPNTNAIMSSVERRFYGIASGAVGTMRTLGMMVSMAIASLIFARFIGRVQITAEYYPAFLKSVKVAFIIFSILCLIGIVSSLIRGKVRTEASEMPVPGKERSS